MTGDNTNNFIQFRALGPKHITKVPLCREVILWQARAEMYNRIQSFKPKRDNI